MQLFANNVTVFLSESVTSESTEFIFDDVSKLPIIGGFNDFKITMYQTVDGVEQNWEVIKVTAVVDGVATVERGQEGTTAREWVAGSRGQMRTTAGTLEMLRDNTATALSTASTAAANATTAFNTANAAQASVTDLSADVIDVQADVVTAQNAADAAQADIDAFQTSLGASNGSSLVGFLQGGSGATPRTVQAKLRDSVNVKDFGATPGSLDDQSPFFNLALAYAKSNGIGIVEAEGTFRFNSNLILRNGVSLLGRERSSLVLEMNGCYVTNETGIGTYCRNTNLRATINSVNGTEQYGLLLAGIEYSEFDVEINDFNSTASVGILCTSVLDGATWRYTRNNQFYNVIIDDCYKSVVLTKDAADPATFGSNFNTFHAGYFSGYTDTGVHVEYGEANSFFGTRCTTNIGSGSIGWLVEDSVNGFFGCTADGSFGGVVPGTRNTYGIPHGRDGDLTTVGFKFMTGSNGCLLLNPRGDACYDRITADSQATIDSICVMGRVDFNRISDAQIGQIESFSAATPAINGYNSNTSGTTQLLKLMSGVSTYGVVGQIRSNGALDFGSLDQDTKFIAGNTAGVPNVVGRFQAADGAFLPENDDAQNLGSQAKNWNRAYTSTLRLTDGISAPATEAGVAIIYVDSADGDLKIKFGDGTVKTIVVDT